METVLLETDSGLAAAMARAESDSSIRCALISGARRGFCASQDLAERDLERRVPEFKGS